MCVWEAVVGAGERTCLSPGQVSRRPGLTWHVSRGFGWIKEMINIVLVDGLDHLFSRAECQDGQGVF